MISLRLNQKTHVACNVNCVLSKVNDSKVTGNHARSKCGNVKTMQDRDGVATDH